MKHVVIGVGVIASLAACSREEPAPKAALHFENVTASSGIDFVTTCGKTPSSQIMDVKGGGLALIDYDEDDDSDLFVPNGATMDSPSKGPGCRLYANRSTAGNLRFEDVTAGSGLSFDRWGFGPCAFDYDGDGKQDVFVACYGEDVLYRNVGGKFEDTTAGAGVAGDPKDWSTAAACGDIDQDGDLDLYVVNYLQFDIAKPPAPSTFLQVPVFGGPRGLPPLPDRCYLNRGDGTFEDATTRLGFDRVDPGYGLGAVILDFDADGKPDVFVGNDSGRNNLFVRADDGTFEDIGTRGGVATNGDGIEQATMGIAVGDVNGDLLPDLFTTNFMNDTNTLHVNLGKRQFSDQTSIYGLGVVSRPFLKWAAGFYDFDLDADEDIVVFQGHVYPKEITDPHDWGHDQAPQLFRREGRRFELVGAEQAGDWLTEKHCDRSAVFDDLDHDGDVDVIVSGLNQPIRVLRNDASGGPFASVLLDDRRPQSKNRRGIGSRLVIDAGGRKQVRWMMTSGGYQSSNPPRIHVGLPGGTKSYMVDVTWLDGTASHYDAQPVDAVATLTRER